MPKLSESALHFKNSFILDLQRNRSAQGARRTQWKGIETTGVNYEKFNKLKDHMKSESHPVTVLTQCFEKWMTSAYKFLLYPTQHEYNFEEIRDSLVDNVQIFIALMFFTTIKLYGLDFKDNENNSDIL